MIARRDRVEEEHGPQAVRGEQFADVGQDREAVRGGEGMVVVVDAGDGDLRSQETAIGSRASGAGSQERQDSADELAASGTARRTTTGTRRRPAFERRKPGGQAAERAFALDLVADDLDTDGSSGTSCPGAATTTTGSTTAQHDRTTRCSITSSPNGSHAFGRPIRDDRPPQSTIPPVRMGPSLGEIRKCLWNPPIRAPASPGVVRRDHVAEAFLGQRSRRGLCRPATRW